MPPPRREGNGETGGEGKRRGERRAERARRLREARRGAGKRVGRVGEERREEKELISLKSRPSPPSNRSRGPRCPPAVAPPPPTKIENTAHRRSNWKNLKRLASKKSKNDLVDVSGAHFKVGDASRSGGRAPAKAINEQGESQVPLWILRCKRCHLGFALLALAGARPPLLEASPTLK